ncbi:hypothetical protein GGX14DRAFT_387727 [Mycena pura]|uniref:DUF6533 domain-containing protein n=1 Tax=Mycena pura TaxID=153505 RepID=A0AAD6YM70_9AGAR|nr:hypothetical protein GGX14DRAFT_387727 [Mycena pura]
MTDSETKYIPLVTNPLKNVILVVSQTLILCYDHLLTLDSEINFLWRRPKRFSFFLFILLRYFSLLSNIAISQTLLNFDDVPPEWSIKTETTISVIDVPGCQYAISKSRIQYTDNNLLQRHPDGRFLCDVVVFGFTVFRSYRQPDKIAGSILDYMVRDGALYFALAILSITMVSRLMLNLHKAGDVGIVTDESIVSSMHFQSQHVIHRDEESNLSREDQIQDGSSVITHARFSRT